MEEPTVEEPTAPTVDWIDPFCPLLSDRIGVRPGDSPVPAHPAAIRTGRALAHFSRAAVAGLPAAAIDGVEASLDDALAAAAGLIDTWRQPLFGGLATDVAGARALTRLALRCGAILDHAHGESMSQSLRALQDKGGFTCTLSEVRNRADLIVCIGTDPTTFAPDFFQRCGIGEAVPDAPLERQVVFLRLVEAGGGAGAVKAGSDAMATLQAAGGVQVVAMDIEGSDLHVVLAELNAACSGRKLPRAGPHWSLLQALAARLRAARYAVLVHAMAAFPGEHAALLAEALGRVVRTLNRTTRAASFALGSADGSATVSQTVTWLTGLPLRTALHGRGFDHDPHRFGARRLLDGRAVDGLLWVSSFSPELLPPCRPADGPPIVVLGHPAMAARFSRRADGSAGVPGRSQAGAGPTIVFIAVATPGVNAAGHLFRGDGGIVLALKPFGTTTLPGVADVVQRLIGLVKGCS